MTLSILGYALILFSFAAFYPMLCALYWGFLLGFLAAAKA